MEELQRTYGPSWASRQLLFPVSPWADSRGREFRSVEQGDSQGLSHHHLPVPWGQRGPGGLTSPDSSYCSRGELSSPSDQPQWPVSVSSLTSQKGLGS